MKNMKLINILLAGVAASTISVGAHAAELPVKAPYQKAPLSFYNWTGFYIGANAGVGVSETSGNIDGRQGSFGRSGAGFAGGVQAGYNWHFSPQWVAGLEGDIGYLGINRSSLDFITTLTLGMKTDWYGTLRGRLGYTNGPSLFYATGGVAFVNVENNFDDPFIAPSFASESETATGWTIGGGIETLLGGNWSAKAEYLYIDAGSQDVINPNILGLAEIAHFDNRFHVYRYGLNYKFGAPTAAGPLPAHNWTGFYVGVNAGAGLSQSRVSNPNDNILFGSTDIADAGFTGGIQAGYNWQLSPNWVVGLEGDIGYLGINRSLEALSAFSIFFAVDTDWYGTARGRIGYTPGPALLYVTGGAAFVNVENSFDHGVILSSKSETATGWTIGGGIEAVLAQNWTAKTEYLYIDAGSQDLTSVAIGTARFDNRFHVFRVGLNYAFNR